MGFGTWFTGGVWTRAVWSADSGNSHKQTGSKAMAIYGNGRWKVLKGRLYCVLFSYSAKHGQQAAWELIDKWEEWSDRKAAEEGITF
jgi:hypothetical protein